ncbi:MULTISPECIES: iron ABC transporter permease [Pseudomonas]|uniref:ABC transporter permease n=1 Tax=Pseudomonas TaxID=286 RepID=UPI0006FB310F|nr:MULTISPECIES: iron ABC transporter permease [unclassified Pseudomonas]KRB02808.1 ABC transporter substrate-binding protein [Pseudomonas sp. Root68]KRB70822.1 ABC transporter substrate-binding protein [Pseudomonas sp. Root71]MBV7491490.1 iron ABC transporter permease [Pseudomonas sp. PDM30]
MGVFAIGTSSATVGAEIRRHRPWVRWTVVSVVLAALFLLVAQPVGWILFNSMHDDTTQQWTLNNYVRLVTAKGMLQPIINSIILAFSTAAISTLLGVPLAWLVARTNMPGRGLIRMLTLGAFVTPSFIGALGWILLAAPNAGWLNTFYRQMSGSDLALFNIYSMGGAIFVCAIYTVPYTFTIVASALDEMAVELEDAATTLGASVLRTMFSVTIPMVMPSVIVGFILSFIQGMTLFGVPAFLLTPSGTSVVTTKLAEFYQLFPPELYMAAAYCMPLLLLTGGLFWVRKKILGRRRFVMIGGKSRAGRSIDLKGWRWAGLLFALIVPVTAVILPYFALIVVSLCKAWGQGPSLSNLTFHWYRWAVLENAETQAAIINSLAYGAIGASLCVLLGTLIAYIVERRLVAGTTIIAALTNLPIIIPGIVLSVGFFAAYTQPPLSLYGTSAIIIAAFVATFLPIAYSHGGAMLKGISPDLERVARILGASESKTFISITAPLMRSGLISGWLLVFIPVMRELSAAVFLITPSTNVMTTLIYNYKDGGNYEAVAAASVLLLVVTMVVVAIAQTLSVKLAKHKRASVELGVAQ